jgi:hypothetical protein
MTSTKFRLIAAAALAFAAGCANYRWTSRVPEELRTVAVPVFENRSMSAELGPIVTQYVLREFQREGTFKIRRAGDSSIEVQGVILSASSGALSYDRSYDNRGREYRYSVKVAVSIINKDTGKVLQDNRPYMAETTYLAIGGDMLTARRDAAARIAVDIARQIVDDVTSWPYNKPAGTGRVEGVQK